MHTCALSKPQRLEASLRAPSQLFCRSAAERDAMAVGGMTVAVSSITDAARRGLEAMREEAMRDERAKITEAQRRARSKW